jgi:hypothetical protein
LLLFLQKKKRLPILAEGWFSAHQTGGENLIIDAHH